MRARREPAASTPPHRKVALLGMVLLTLIITGSTVATIEMRRTERNVEALAARARVVTQLQDLRRSMTGIQLALEQGYSSTEPAARAERLAEWDDQTNTIIGKWSAASRDDNVAPIVGELDATYLAWLESVYVARNVLGAPVAAGAAPVVDIEATRERYRAITEAVDGHLATETAEVIEHADDSVNATSRALQIQVAVSVAAIVIGVAVIHATYRTSRAQHREIERRDAARAVDLRRIENETRVNRALEYSRSEQDVYRSAEQALAELVPDRPTELLIADSSRAHFTVTARTRRDDDWTGCGVPTPGDCPAVVAGQTLVFESSERFDACPFLKDRPSGPCSAACVPVSINGVAEAVLHSTGRDGVRVDNEARHLVELLGSRAGDRIGVLRAFSRSESQAATDSLTGLDNRRSFENKVAALLQEPHRTLVVAFGDLDHFKRLNDAHGHDTGDRALRAFAHTFRHAVRPGDVVARWGGEEFVVAFPDTTDDVAVAILDRVRGELAEVVAGGGVPAFTVSFGVSEGTEPDLEAHVASADRALLAAKRAGRDRVVRAATLRVAGADGAAGDHPGPDAAGGTVPGEAAVPGDAAGGAGSRG